MMQALLVTILGLMLLANAAYSVYLCNQLPLKQGLPKDIYVEVGAASALLFVGTLLSIFSSREICSAPQVVGLQRGKFVVSSRSAGANHPLRPLAISKANSAAENTGRSPYQVLESRPGFAHLTQSALLFAAHPHAALE